MLVRNALALLMPVSMYLVQVGVIVSLGQFDILGPYLAFVGSFLLFGSLGLGSAPIRLNFAPKEKEKLIDAFFIVFVCLELICFVYFFLIFLAYVRESGYAGVRNFMTSDLIKTTPYYFAPLMYISSYILWALEAIVILAAFYTRRYVVAITVLSCVTIHHVIFLASRILLYEYLIVGFIAMLHQRIKLSRLFIWASVIGVATVLLSTVISFIRDDAIQASADEGVLGKILGEGVLNYHLVSPLILQAITKSSTYFLNNTGFGLATFGFLIDPLIAILPVDDAKSLMASHILSGEAQNFILSFDDHDYNAFTTLLYPALFDFGLLGPILYGGFLGYGCGKSFTSQNIAGALVYIVFARFVYLGSFTFSITGEWFWVLAAVLFFSTGSVVRPEVVMGSPERRPALTERKEFMIGESRIFKFFRASAIYDSLESFRGQAVSLRAIVSYLRSSLPVFMVAFVVCGIFGALYFSMATRQYRASALVMLSDSARNGGAPSASVESVASLAGISLPGSPSQEPIAFLRSRHIASKFIEDNRLLPKLFEKKWDSAAGRWKPMEDRKVPDVRDGIKVFQRSILLVNEDKKAGTIDVQVTWSNPQIAAEWAGKYVDLVNDEMRAAVVAESSRMVDYLRNELEQSGGQIGVQQAVSRALEAQLQRVALARARKDYALKVIDPPLAPKDPVSPKLAIVFLETIFISLLVGIGASVLIARRYSRAL